MSVIKIKGVVKNFEWGRQDVDSLVWKYSGETDFKQDSYAELWMGSHPSGPSITEDGGSLPSFLAERKQKDLQYLFKILSINKCLSIQAHPNKAQAEELHSKDPKNYPDANDKPELFLTLTPFKALMGFISEEEFVELRNTFPFDSLESQSVRDAIQELITLPKERADQMISDIVSQRHSFKQRGYLIEKMHGQFGSDVGILVSFLMNYRELPAGEAFYIRAGQPHSYVEGEILQLMINSDNVIRCGLTPKFKDVSVMFEVLDYSNREIEKLQKIQGCYRGGILRLYELLQGEALDLPERSICLVLEGEFIVNGCQLKEREIAFVDAGKVAVSGKGKLYLATNE